MGFVKEGGLLELADTNARDKDTEEEKRRKAKLLKKLKEQEGIAGANQQVMVRDRRRPRKSIKEMSVLNKRRRVIKNTARKELLQKKATIESMRHIELKRYSLEARELAVFVERVRKVKENKRLTMLFAKMKVEADFEELRSVREESQLGKSQNSSCDNGDRRTLAPASPEDKEKTESMSLLIDELQSMNSLIDYDAHPQWKSIMQGVDNGSMGVGFLKNFAQEYVLSSKGESKSDPTEPEPRSSGPVPFGSRLRKNLAQEAPAELQSNSINRFPKISGQPSKDDMELPRFGYSSVRRSVSQPGLNGYSPTPSPVVRKPSTTNIISSGTDICEDNLGDTLEDEIKVLSRAPSTPRKTKPLYHSNWREREKRGDTLYSPVALSPIRSGLISPDFSFEEDELIENFRKKLNPKRFQSGPGGSGDMEFSVAMTKIPSEKRAKKVGYQGDKSIMEIKLLRKTQSISDKVKTVREETMQPTKPRASNTQKSVAQVIHQQGDGKRFLHEVQSLRQFASLCNCKYLRTDPERLDERRNGYINELISNVSRRMQIRNKWKMGLSRGMSLRSVNSPAGISLPLITQRSTQ